MAEEREARGTRHRGATAVRAEITPMRGASQHQMVSRRDPYLHLQRGRRVNAGEQRHSRQVTCVFSTCVYSKFEILLEQLSFLIAREERVC